LLDRAVALERLVLKGAELLKFALLCEDRLERVDTQRSDELILKILVAHEESERLDVAALEVTAVTRSLKRSRKIPFLADVVQAGESNGGRWDLPREVWPDVGRAAE
jgi:hypothetical protein